MPTRDLTVNIDGDPAGFDAAFKAAEEEAKGLDRELAKLTKTQTAQERVTARTTAAVRKYGTEQGKAALAARKLGTEAEKAAERATRATERADKAAEAYKAGLIDEARAAHLAARAEDAIERAALKAAEAHRAAARAADEQAQQERQIARDAELAAAAQRLGALRAAGATREHNRVLRDLETQFGDLEKVGGAAFREMESIGTKAFGGISSAASSFAESGPAAIALTVAALGAVPFVALAAETAITAGVGGGLAALGLMATKSDKQVQAALHQTASHVKSEARQIAAPFKQTWLEIAHDADTAFSSIAPELRRDFALLAPAVSRFVHAGALAVHELDPALHAATVGTVRLADALGGRLPSITHSLASAITIMGNSVANNADGIANFAANTARILPVLAAFLDYSVRLGHAVSPLFDVMTSGAGTVNSLEKGLSFLSGGMLHLGSSTQKTGNDFSGMATIADTAATATRGFKTAEDLATLSSKQLSDALQKLAGGNLAEDQAVTAAAEALKAASKAADHHRKVSLAEKSALEDVASADLNVIQRMKDNHESATVLESKMASLRASFIRVARQMGYTGDEARKLATRYGLLPARKDTRISSNAAQQRREVAALERQIAALRGKKITITTIERTFHYTTNQLINKTSGPGGYGGRAGGGLVHRAGGGPIQHMDDGGLSGMIYGPGSGTSDSIPAMLSNGEYVVNARSTAMYRPLLDAINYGRGRVPAAAVAAGGGSSGGSRIVLEFRGDGSRYGEFLVQELRKHVRTKGGGNVQLAFGGG